MARYEDDYHWNSYRGFSLRPEPIGEDSLDPNYRGGYQGMRMGNGYEGQAAYGRHRAQHAGDLGGEGGFPGRQPPMRYEPRDGTYHRGRGYGEEYRGGQGGGRRGYDTGMRRGYDRDPRVVEDGGVRADNRYLGQFNSDSPVFRQGGGRGGAYDRNYGWAEGSQGGRPRQGPYDRDMHPRDSNRYGGYSSGGFGERWLPGPRPRGA